MTGKNGQLRALFGLEEMWTNNQQSGVFLKRVTSADAGREFGGHVCFHWRDILKITLKEPHQGGPCSRTACHTVPVLGLSVSPLLACPGTKFSLAPRCPAPIRQCGRGGPPLRAEMTAPRQPTNRNSRCDLLRLPRITVLELDAY